MAVKHSAILLKYLAVIRQVYPLQNDVKYMYLNHFFLFLL